MADKVLVNLATGMEDAERVVVAFLVATSALAQGKQVVVWATKEAVRLALPGEMSGVACKGCPPLEQLAEQFADGGGELWVCPICLNARDLGEAEKLPIRPLTSAGPAWQSRAMPGWGGTSQRRRFTRHLHCVAVLSAVPALVLAPPAIAQPTTRFISKRYAYSIVLPGNSSRWTSSFATVAWSGPAIRGAIDSPAIDDFTDQVTGRSYLLAARPTRLNLQQWAENAISIRSPSCGVPQTLPNSTLAGAPARVFTWSCANGYKGIMITALHSGRGYFMLVASPTSLSRTSNLRAFDAARRSFRFLHK